MRAISARIYLTGCHAPVCSDKGASSAKPPALPAVMFKSSLAKA